jgi:hypothetical protein
MCAGNSKVSEKLRVKWSGGNCVQENGKCVHFVCRKMENVCRKFLVKKLFLYTLTSKLIKKEELVCRKFIKNIKKTRPNCFYQQSNSNKFYKK